MAIPEVQTRAKLVAFLEKYFAKKGSGGGGSGTPAGSNTQVQYNNAGSFGGSANLTFDGTTLTATGLSNTGNTTLGDASGDSVTINAATINPANIAAGTDNTVVVYNGSTLVTDEIDSRVWGSTLIDASGTPADNQVGIWTDANTMEGSSNLTFDGTDLTVANDLILGSDIIHSGDTDTKIALNTNTQIYTCANSERLKLNSTGVGLMGATPIAGLAVTGDLTISGDTTLGDASADSLTINAQTINPANIAAGTDNTVVVYNGSSLVTDEIDSRVWGSTLVDASGTPADNQVGIWTDANTMEGSSNLTFDGTDLTVANDLILGAEIIHSGDTDTKIAFGTNTQIYTCQNSERLRLNSTGVSLMGATPIAGLAVTGEISSSGDITVGAGQYLRTNGIAAVGSDGNEVRLGSAATSKTLALYSDVGAALTIDAVGNVTTPYQPAVYAFLSSTQDFSPNTDPEVIIFNDESTTNNTAFDVGSDYNTSTGIFTAPADGKYLVQSSALLTKVPTDSVILIYCESTNSAADGIKMYSNRIDPDLISGSTDPIDYLFVEGTWLVNMDASDTAKIYAYVTAGISTTKIFGHATNQYTRIQVIKVA